MDPVSGLEFICDRADHIMAVFINNMYFIDNHEYMNYSHLVMIEDEADIDSRKAAYELAKRVLASSTSRMSEITKTQVELHQCRVLIFELMQYVGAPNRDLYGDRIAHTFNYIDKAIEIVDQDHGVAAKQTIFEMTDKLVCLANSM